MYCPDQPINPSESYFETEVSYDRYQCTYCSEIHTEVDVIHEDSLSNGNICKSCLNQRDMADMLGMGEYEFRLYKERTEKLNPINNI